MTADHAVSLEPNETHDPELRSWVETANEEDADFPIQNLPLGAFARAVDSDEEREADERVGVAIGNQIVDVFASREQGAFAGHGDLVDDAARACAGPTLNPLMGLGPGHGSALRRALQAALVEGSELRDRVVLIPMAEARMVLPVDIGDYTDFYCSIHHATNVGSMFRPENPLLPNYKHIPIGYHGRASSVVASGTPVRRPSGQTKTPDADAPTFGPTKLLDYELEVGFFVGAGNELGSPVSLDESEGQLFGFVLVNDWSARDIQGWEYQPLGPFLAKSFQTSVSPWVVTAEALAPFRGPAFERAAGDPRPLPHLSSERNRRLGGIDMVLEVFITSEKMRAEGGEPFRLSRGNFRDMYWTAAQMLSHHCSNGCNLRPGDLMASGTVSGAEKGSRGCMLELTWRGAEPIELPSGETRRFLQDGDELILSGYCERPGAKRIGLGECRGLVLPARL
ncbi:MAG: fumarylacetoacetase [Holophagales bacterium]|nr:fumarylacetoacetase [Holophagales bacterium]